MNTLQIFHAAWWKRYAIAMTVVAFAAFLRIWPLHILGSTLAWLTFYPAVMVVAIYGGLSAGLLATVLAALTVTFLWPLLVAEPFIKDLADWVGMSVFIFTGSMISGMAEAMRRAQNRATEALAKAEAANTRFKNMKLSRDRYAESEKTLSLFIDHAPVSIVMLDREMRYLAVSKRWIADFNLGEKEIIGVSHYEIFPEVSDDWKKVHRQGLRGEVISADEDRFERADGSVQWIRWEVRPWYHIDGAIGGIIILSEDITKRKHAEESLHESEERYRSLFETMQEGFSIDEILIDENGKPYDLRYLTANPAFERHTGLKAQDIIGRTVLELFPDTEAVWFELYGKVALTGELLTFEEKFGPLGKWFNVTAYPLENCRIAVIFSDITIRKQAVEAIRSLNTVLEQRVEERTALLTAEIMEREKAQQALKQYAAIIDSSDDAIVSKTLTGIVTSWNAGAEHMFGYSRDEAVGQPIYLIIPEQYQAEETEMMQKISKGESINHYEAIRRRKDGKLIDVSVTLSPIRDQDGKIVGASKSARNITERKHTEEALQKSEQDYRILFDSMDEGYCVVEMLYDPLGKPVDYRFIKVNSSFEKHTGLSQALGKTMREMVPDHEAHWYEIYGKVARTGESIRFENPANAMNRYYDVYAFRNGGEGSNKVGILFKDITERKRGEALLISAKEHAEAANHAKSLFLSTMSHELRTPLNAILGFSSMMRNDPALTDGQRDNLDIINRSGGNLLNLINDVLDMAKIESGHVVLDIKPFDLGVLVRDIIDMLSKRTEEKGLQLVLDQSSEFPRFIKSDKDKLRQVIVNLVGNAVKYTNHGEVTLRLGVYAPLLDPTHEERLIIEVEDSGIGISKDDQARIFEPFIQVGKPATQKGTGLGLSIVNEYVKLMGGEIEVESKPDVGSLFRVTLPIIRVEEADVMSSETVNERIIGLEPDQPEYRILIVEDQLENQLLLMRLLEEAGFSVAIAQNGAEGVELFQSYQPHFIWMDRRMPVMDGLEATKHIRALPGGNEVKIAAVTASAFADEREETLAGGMDDFVRKPYRPTEIFDCMARLLGVRFVHEHAAQIKIDSTISAASFTKLPEALRDELTDNLVLGNTEQLDQLILRIEQQDFELAKLLASYVAAFNYLPILNALDSVNSKNKEAIL